MCCSNFQPLVYLWRTSAATGPGRCWRHVAVTALSLCTPPRTRLGCRQTSPSSPAVVPSLVLPFTLTPLLTASALSFMVGVGVGVGVWVRVRVGVRVGAVFWCGSPCSTICTLRHASHPLLTAVPLGSGNRAGTLTTNRKTWFSSQETVFHRNAGDGPVHALAWGERLLAWSSDTGVRVRVRGVASNPGSRVSQPGLRVVASLHHRRCVNLTLASAFPLFLNPTTVPPASCFQATSCGKMNWCVHGVLLCSMHMDCASLCTNPPNGH